MSDAPQGTVLGPILLLLNMNDLPDLLQGDLLLLADVVKLINASANFDDLQLYFPDTGDCTAAWDLPFNENKCGHISIGSAPSRPLTLSDNGISTKILDSTQELGITIDSSFKPSMDCAQAFKRVHAALFLIRRSFILLTPKSVILLYSKLVRPHLEYAMQASSLNVKKDMDHFERFQRLATRIAEGCRGLSFVERLEKQSPFSRVRQRLRSD